MGGFLVRRLQISGGDGTLTIHEIGILFEKKLGKPLPSRDLKKIMRQLDEDGNGFVDWEEFLNEYPALEALIEQSQAAKKQERDRDQKHGGHRISRFTSSSPGHSSKETKQPPRGSSSPQHVRRDSSSSPSSKSKDRGGWNHEESAEAIKFPVAPLSSRGDGSHSARSNPFSSPR